MIKLRAQWLPSAEHDLLHWVPSLEKITAIAATVEAVAARFGDLPDDGRVTRSANNPRVVLIDVGGNLVISGFVDPLERVLYVSALNPSPDPDADPNSEPEPDEYEEDE